jgi:hypothetical protein
MLPRLRLFVGQEPWTFYDDFPPGSHRRRESYTQQKTPQKPAKLKKFGDTLQGNWHGRPGPSSSTRETQSPASRKKRGGVREDFQRT